MDMEEQQITVDGHTPIAGNYYGHCHSKSN